MASKTGLRKVAGRLLLLFGSGKAVVAVADARAPAGAASRGGKKLRAARRGGPGRMRTAGQGTEGTVRAARYGVTCGGVVG